MRVICLFVFFIWLVAFCNGADHVIYERCMRGKFHKIDPSPEADLKLCSHFKEKSCCTNDTASSLRADEDDALYNFNYSHCAPMSDKCKQFFLMNNCFYECSPNVWPWLTPLESSYRREKYHHVPLCASNCNQWWDACKEEATCVTTWSTGFVWKNKVNQCPEGKKCQSFEQTYKNSTFFCENIWGPQDYKVVDDSDTSKPCLTFTFTQDNPNTKVADYYAKKKGLVCDKTETDAHIKKLRTESAILGVFLGLIVFVLLTACYAYSRYADSLKCNTVESSNPPQRMINLSQAYTSGNDGSLQSTDSKNSFTNNLFDDDREPLTV